MAKLHNKVSRKELKQKLKSDPTPRRTISFYKYFHIDDPVSFRNQLYKGLTEIGVFGRIYLASEGINAQISVPEPNHGKFLEFINSLNGLNGIRLNESMDRDPRSFYVLDIKVRKQIVADGINDPDFSVNSTGKYVNAREFNKMAHDPDTVIIDMRNHYEYEVGHFKDAIEIPSDTFREQLPMAANMMKNEKNKNIIMYCTGGIRCEKASAWMLHNGFKNVFHLEGGIINYVRQVREEGLENRFIGKNFVFDERLGERVTEDVIATCHQCGKPADTHINCANNACHLLFIQCQACSEKYDGCCSLECQQFIKLPAEIQKGLRKGQNKGRNVFNKSRSRRQQKS